MGCTYELLSFIPSLLDPGKTVRDEMREFNERVKTYSHSRLVRSGKRLDVARMERKRAGPLLNQP